MRTAGLAGLTGAVPEADLHEWDHGGYEGVTTADVHRTRPGWDLGTDRVPPGDDGRPGESPQEVGRRADRVLARLDATLAQDARDVVLVAHARFLRVLPARRLGLPPADGRLFQLATGTLSRLSTEHDRPVIAECNTRPDRLRPGPDRFEAARAGALPPRSRGTGRPRATIRPHRWNRRVRPRGTRRRQRHPCPPAPGAPHHPQGPELLALRLRPPS